MDNFWSQKSSVTRDFSLLSVVIIFIAVLTSIWVTYETYIDQSQKITAELEQESLRVDRALRTEIERASYLLEAIGRQILQRDAIDITIIAKMLRTFDASSEYYSLFLWVNEDMQAITSSRQGILTEPVDISDRPYILQSKAEPFKIQVGAVQDGRVSERTVLPLAMGLTDYTGKYIGSVTLSLDLHALSQSARQFIRNPDIGFAILSDNLEMLVTDEHAKKALDNGVVLGKLSNRTIGRGQEGIVTMPDLFDGNRSFSYFRAPPYSPYIILTVHNNEWNALNRLILPRLTQLALVAAFLVSLLWLVRFRVIYPVQMLVQASSEIAHGNSDINVPRSGPLEIIQLSRHLQRVVAYIAERKRIEEELIAKVLALKTAKDIAEVNDQAKMEILRVLRQEALPAMEHVMSATTILQEQPYGKINGKEYQQHIDRLDRGSTHLAEVIHEVFEFPRLMEAEPMLIRKPVDVTAVLHKCVVLLSATLRQEEVKVSIRTPDALPKLPINELHLIHVVMHLLLVCVRALPAGGELTLEATLEENGHSPEFAIYFKDNGTGLDTQLIGQLWRANDAPYHEQRANDISATRLSRSHAVTLTKKIISLHNGRMTLQSPPGKEAHIAVYFEQ